MEEASASGIWDPKVDGWKQLRELNAMERSQDSNYWLSSAILVAANAVLVAEFFRQESHYLARFCISVIGFVIAIVMVLLVSRARVYKSRWLDKAKAIEKELGVPAEYSVWEDKGLPGFPASQALILAMYGFVIVWVAGAVFAASNLLLENL